jgi:hypothetical protein
VRARVGIREQHEACRVIAEVELRPLARRVDDGDGRDAEPAERLLDAGELEDLAPAERAVQAAEEAQEDAGLVPEVRERHGTGLAHGRQAEIRGRIARTSWFWHHRHSVR